ncbi:MAG: type II secretion system GspH family protein [Magnetococcus sp. THC-1_WYH]
MTKILRNNSGFTLTEMAMVVMLMGIIGSILVTSLNARMSQTSYTVTKQRMAAIQETMISFLRVNGRLPCPDGNTDAELFDGIEDPLGGGVCDNGAFGVLPYSTLRLSREQVIDGWGNFFSYHVSQTTDPWTTVPPGTDPINDTYLGELIIENTANNVVMVVVSHGPNGTGAYTIKGTRNVLPFATDELENTNNTANLTYIERDFTDNINALGGPFDDIVGYMTVGDLVGPLIKEGSVQSANMALERQLEEIKNLLKGHILQSFSGSPCAFPATLTALGLSTTMDPWGTAFTYNTPAAITVGTIADADDIITVDSTHTALNPDIKMTKQQAVGLLASAGRSPPACLDHSYGVISDLFSKVKHTLIAYMVNHFSSDSCDFPATLDDPSLGLPTTDPWGGNLAYTPVTISETDPGTTIIFTVTSTITFPDASTVDYTLVMTKAEANGLMTAAGVTPAGCL